MKNKEEPPSEECHPVSTMPSEDEVCVEDGQAMLEAARHREHASSIVRDHLESHVANNPGASSDYVTWIATLHPENADITIDQRFFVPENPWWTIYEETKNNPIPFATAVPVKNESDDKENSVKTADDEETGASSNDCSSTSETDPEQAKDPNCCLTCNPFAILFGFVMAIPAVVWVVSCEMISLLICYLPSVFCHKTAKIFSPPDCCTCLFYLIFMTIYGVLSFCDSVVLVVNVFGTEMVAFMAVLVGFLSGGCLWAKFLHQQIRRVCHGIRVVFRKKTSHRDPPRRFFCYPSAEEEKPHLRGVRVVRVERVRCPGESWH